MTTSLEDKPKLINSHIVKCEGQRVTPIKPVEALLLTFENGRVDVRCPYFNREYSVCNINCLDNLTPCTYLRR